MVNLWIIVSLVILILLSGTFSATETAYTSFNKARMKNQTFLKKSSKLALELNKNYHKVLTTILIGNNIANVTAAALATVLFVNFYGNKGVTIATVVLTLTLLVFSEITPKSVAKKRPEIVAALLAKPLKYFSIIVTPLSFLFNKLEIIIVKVFKLEKAIPSLTEEELKTIVSDINEEGIINDLEHELLQKSIVYDDILAKSIMIPLEKAISLDYKQDINDISNLVRTYKFSRYPVFKDDIFNIVGIVYLKDFYEMMLKKENNIESIIREPIYVNENIKISALFKTMQKSKIHFSIVLDATEKVISFMTMEEIL